MKIVIAIDGPAASGKSSVSRQLAGRLGFAYVNSGTMYRAITWEVLRLGLEGAPSGRIAEELASSEIRCGFDANNQSFIRINDRGGEAELRDRTINQHVSRVSAIPAVREIVSQQLHRLARERDLVMEGRDIGSVVFPDTPYKFYLDASAEIRRKRRADEGEADLIEDRDRMDSSRKAAPLRVADDARVVDTSHLTLEGVVEVILAILREAGMK